jgi:hypothetical protein
VQELWRAYRHWLRAHSWAISAAGRAQGAGRQSHNSDHMSQHVEEFHAVTGLSAGDIMPFDNGADIACTYTFFWISRSKTTSDGL